MENKEFFEKREENFFEGEVSFPGIWGRNEGESDMTSQCLLL